MAVPIKNSSIPYLSRQILDAYASVTIISKSGLKILVNPLAFSAFSDFLVKNDVNETLEDIKIITEYEIEDLKCVVDFVSQGICPKTIESWAEMTLAYSELFADFGIRLQNVLSVKIPHKTEPLVEIFDKPISEDQIKVEIDDHFDDIIEDLPLNLLPKPSKKSLKKRKKSVKKIIVKNNYDKSEDWLPNSEIDHQEIPDKKPKLEIKPRNSKELKRLKLNAIEKRINQDYRIIRQQYGHIISSTIPETFMSETDLFEDYTLPFPLDSYIKPPVPDENQAKFTSDNPVECSKCLLKFANLTKLQSHDLKSHQKHYACSYCERPFPVGNDKDFSMHIYRHEKMSVKPHECIHCGFTSYIHRVIVNHATTQGPFHTSTCPQCPTKFTNYKEYKKHLEDIHCDQKICGSCGKFFLTEEILKNHMISAHKGVKFTRKGTEKKGKYNPHKKVVCDLCGKPFAGSLYTHKMKIHAPADPQECPHCHKIFKTPIHLASHISALHKKYPCDLCGIMIANKHKLRHFQQYHVDPEKRKYKCEHCAKGFSTNQALKDHVNIHTGERPYICKFCGKTFASSGNKQMHVRTTHLGHKRSK